MARITLANVRAGTVRHKGMTVLAEGTQAGKSEAEILADLAKTLGLNESGARHWYKWGHINCGLDAETPIVAAPTWSGRAKKESVAAPSNAAEAKDEALDAAVATILSEVPSSEAILKDDQEDMSDFLKEIEAEASVPQEVQEEVRPSA